MQFQFANSAWRVLPGLAWDFQKAWLAFGPEGSTAVKKQSGINGLLPARARAPSIYSVCFLRSAARSEEGGCHFSAGKVLFHLKPVLVESSFLADGLRQQCKLAATEQNAHSIVGEATKATRRVTQCLDFGVKAFGHSVGNGMKNVV